MYLLTRKKNVFFPVKLTFCTYQTSVTYSCVMVVNTFIFKVILVQVNPGEAFTIRREDGQFQCITGKVDTFILIFSESESGLMKGNLW